MRDPQRNTLAGLEFRQVDVFSRTPLAGNGLAVFPNADGLDSATMLALAQEMRQFESIFLTRPKAPDSPGAPQAFAARMFTVEEELDFAGHPVLGAACVLHDLHGGERDECTWTLHLNAANVTVATWRRQGWYETEMDQGAPVFGPALPPETVAQLLAAQGLEPNDLIPGLPVQVVSTGLPYLFIPLRTGLERARPAHPEFEALLAAVGAKFCYPLHIATHEGRSFDNHGLLEDVATGSAAGPAGAYLVHHGLAAPDETLVIRQGRFVQRPSEISVRIQGPSKAPTRALVGGEAVFVALGTFL